MLVKELANQTNIYPNVIVFFLHGKKRWIKASLNSIKNYELTSEEVDTFLSHYMISNKDHNVLVHRYLGLDNNVLSMKETVAEWKKMQEKFTVISYGGSVFLFRKREEK